MSSRKQYKKFISMSSNKFFVVPNDALYLFCKVTKLLFSLNWKKNISKKYLQNEHWKGLQLCKWEIFEHLPHLGCYYKLRSTFPKAL